MTSPEIKRYAPLPCLTCSLVSRLVGCDMTLLSLPTWVDTLVNVIAYAGFIAIATWHKSSDEITTRSPRAGYLHQRE